MANRRPGSLAIWILALLGVGLGVAIGDGMNQLGYHATLIAYVVVAPVSAGLVRRGRDLRMLTLCLPLTLLIGLAAAADVALRQSGEAVSAKSLATEVGQTLILNPGWLWGGTLLAVLVGLRRGLLRRAR